MLERYADQKAANVWTSLNKFKILLSIEIAAAEAMADEGLVPLDAAKALRASEDKIVFDESRIAEIEATVKHDVIAFLTHVAEQIGDNARYLHLGLTSSDVLDTTFAVQLTHAADLIIKAVENLCIALKKRAIEHENTLCIGRSHGMHAEPTTFGLKLAGFYAEMRRNIKRLRVARAEVAVCALSGPVGTYSSVSPNVEAKVASLLGLRIEIVSTQVIPRDRHAAFFAALAITAASLERLAVEIRHLQRNEVQEAEEPFTMGQKGSSAMPHKRNPILSENVTGLCRLIRGYLSPALENVTLWHERDISHSSVERFIAPDACITLHFALKRMTGLINDLVVYPQNMLRNLNKSGGVYASQGVLLALTKAGMKREDAYTIVQKAAHTANETKSFIDNLLSDDNITSYLTANELRALGDPNIFLTHVTTIFQRLDHD